MQQRKKLLKAIALCLVAGVVIMTLSYASHWVLNSRNHQSHAIDTKYHRNGAAASTRRFAYATVMVDPEMLNATLVALYSLQQHSGAKADRILVVPEGSSIAIPEGLEVQILEAPMLLKSDEFSIVLHLWTLSPYDKIVYFSGNTLFTKNIDHVFEFPNKASFDGKSLIVLEPVEQVLDQYKVSSLSASEFLIKECWLDRPKQPLDGMIIFDRPMQPWNFQTYHNSNWRVSYDPVSFYQWRQMFDALYDKFSALVSTYSPERIEHLSLLINHLLGSPVVDMVFVTWHNPLLEVPPELLVLEREQRVRILQQKFDSLNNRFNPIPDLQTEAVYIVDDDIFLDLNDLEYAFEAWKLNKDSLVGHFPRIHTYDNNTKTGVYKVANLDRYSMVLTKSMFIHADYLFAYTCVMDMDIHRQVDTMLNCEDIAFALMVSGMTASTCVASIPANPIVDFGLNVGISTNNNHMPARGLCLANFINQFWQGVDPLGVSTLSLTPYKPPVVRRGHWEQMIADITHFMKSYH